VAVNGKNYQIHIIESKVETEDLIRIIFMITLGLIILVVLILYVINRLAIKKLWQPFYKTLHEIKLFNLADKRNIVQFHSDIEEFQELNESVGAMALRVVHDYQELKSFMENASHELMTPIAVINSKLDTMIQQEDLNQRQSELFGDIYETVSKLTRLNKTMLLLSKIENKLINDEQEFSVGEALDSTMNQFHELFAGKQLKVNTEFTGDKQLIMSRSLFDVLLNNLLSNAMRHNYPGGRIEVLLDSSGISIRNTGKPVPLDSENIFQRFKKSAESEGSGLGLTLSKQICENYHLKLDYSFEDDLHIFTVTF
jgi:signal transduction histidine kinase